MEGRKFFKEGAQWRKWNFNFWATAADAAASPFLLATNRRTLDNAFLS